MALILRFNICVQVQSWMSGTSIAEYSRGLIDPAPVRLGQCAVKSDRFPFYARRNQARTSTDQQH